MHSWCLRQQFHEKSCECLFGLICSNASVAIHLQAVPQGETRARIGMDKLRLLRIDYEHTKVCLIKDGKWQLSLGSMKTESSACEDVSHVCRSYRFTVISNEHEPLVPVGNCIAYVVLAWHCQFASNFGDMDTLCVGCDNRSGNTGASIARTFLLFLLVEGARGRMVDARNLPFFDVFFCGICTV